MTLRSLILLRPPLGSGCPSEQIAVAGWAIRVATDVATARAMAEEDQHVGLAWLESPDAFDWSELEALTASQRTEWIATVTAHCLLQPQFAKFILESFYDYHTLPLDLPRLLILLGHAHGKSLLKCTLNDPEEWVGKFQMIGRSPAMQELYRQLTKIAKVDAPVLISGQSGTGKELAARAMHRHSERADAPFVPVNCGALPTHLIQSELFGHEKGAFTGAHARKIGSIESAAGGVIFLDEIGDLPLELQSNLLRFLQEKTIVRVGSTQRIPIDVRVIAATHVDLERAVAEHRFRGDLFYRLNVLRLHVPALCERVGDISLLAQAFFRDLMHQRSPQVQGFSLRALRAMATHKWPGNVRELINRVQNAMIMSENRLISDADLGLSAVVAADRITTLDGARAAIEQDVIRRTLLHNNNNVSQAARQLGISRVTLYRLMSKFEIDPE
jgi:DNA-binding NtrC family response regulator